MAKAIITFGVWTTGPYTSNASMVTFLADIPVVFQVLVVLFLILKMALFDYTSYIPDTDPRGEENYEEATTVDQWNEKDGEVVARQDWSHDNIKVCTGCLSSLSLDIRGSSAYFYFSLFLLFLSVHPTRVFSALPLSTPRS